MPSALCATLLRTQKTDITAKQLYMCSILRRRSTPHSDTRTTDTSGHTRTPGHTRTYAGHAAHPCAHTPSHCVGGRVRPRHRRHAHAMTTPHRLRTDPHTQHTSLKEKSPQLVRGKLLLWMGRSHARRVAGCRCRLKEHKSGGLRCGCRSRRRRSERASQRGQAGSVRLPSINCLRPAYEAMNDKD